MPEFQTRAARSEIRRHLGVNVAEKATDAFCLAMYDHITGPVNPLGAESLELVTTEPSPGLAMLEFGDLSATDLRAEFLHSPVHDLPGIISPSLLLRERLVEINRARAYQAMDEVTQRLQLLVPRYVKEHSQGPEDPNDARSFGRRRCWLNSTAETFAEPKIIADVADDYAVRTIDLPHMAKKEVARLNHQVIRLPDYLQRHPSTGNGVPIAIIDGEVDYATLGHQVTLRRNLTHEDWGFADKHGTAVAGIAAGALPPVGIAPGATVYNYKIFPLASDTTLDIVVTLAMQYAVEDGALIANCSLGTGPVGSVASREALAASNAWLIGMTVVKSSGNNGPGSGSMTRPAEAPEIIVVGATDLQATRVARYSSRGPHFSRSGPDVVAPGEGVINCLSNYSARGTSFAAPHVSGLAALFLEEDPTQTPNQLRQRLMRHSQPLPNCPPAAQGQGLCQAI